MMLVFVLAERLICVMLSCDRSITFSAVNCASLCLGNSAYMKSFDTSSLPLREIMNFIKGGCKAGCDDDMCLTLLGSSHGMVTFSNSTIDYLYRGSSLASLGSYAFFSFYEKEKKNAAPKKQDKHEEDPPSSGDEGTSSLH